METIIRKKRNIQASDIDVYIMSHNRSSIICETVDSFLNQTVKGFSLSVIDNSDDESVLNILKTKYKLGYELNYYRNPNGKENNFLEVKRLDLKPWVIAFHDDDIVHPQYIEHALAALNADEEVTELVSLTDFLSDVDKGKWKNYCKPEIKLLKNSDELAFEYFRGTPIPFCSIIYKSEYFKNTPSFDSTFGKISDRPFAIESARNGKIALLNGKYVQTRVDTFNRDSNTSSNGPFVNEVISLMIYYRNRIGENIFSYKGRIFLFKSLQRLLVESPRTLNTAEKDMSNFQFMKKCIEKKGMSWFGAIVGLPYYIAWTFMNNFFSSKLKEMSNNRRRH